jgi:hypothetical protein
LYLVVSIGKVYSPFVSAVVLPTVAPVESNTVIVAPAKGEPVAAVPDKLVPEEEVGLEELPPPPPQARSIVPTIIVTTKSSWRFFMNSLVI